MWFEDSFATGTKETEKDRAMRAIAEAMEPLRGDDEVIVIDPDEDQRRWAAAWNGSMKPILFNGEMVRAILDGRKTVTRRLVKPQPMDTADCKHEMVTFHEMIPDYYRGDYSCACRKCGWGVGPKGDSVFKPTYLPGDILYVRESWGVYCRKWWEASHFEYRASWKAEETPFGLAEPPKWRPSIHMPKDAARIFLLVTDVRVERLQDITEEQAVAEGVADRAAFASLWDSTIAPSKLDQYGWDANPWVWATPFECVDYSVPAISQI